MINCYNMNIPTGTSWSYLDSKILKCIEKLPHFQLEIPGGNRFWKVLWQWSDNWTFNSYWLMLQRAKRALRNLFQETLTLARLKRQVWKNGKISIQRPLLQSNPCPILNCLDIQIFWIINFKTSIMVTMKLD